MLNVNEMAEGYSYFAVGGRSVSTNNNLLAFSVDTVSRREYTLQFKDLTTGEILDDRIPNISGGATWANDNRTVFDTKKDPSTLRSYRNYKHVLGTDASADVVVYEETDETFSCGVGKTKSEAYLMIGSYSTVSSEWRFLDANTPEGAWQIIQPRERDLEYGCSHYGDHFYITTNREAKTSSWCELRSTQRPTTTGKTCCRTAMTCCSRASTFSRLPRRLRALQWFEPDPREALGRR